MESPLTSSAFSSSRKAYIHQTQRKIKGLVYRDVEVGLGFEKSLGLVNTTLGVLLDFSKHLEKRSEEFGSEHTSVEEIRAQERYLNYEFEIAVNMCHVVDYYIERRNNIYHRVFGDVEDFDMYNEGEEEEMRWLKAQMDEFTERATGFSIGERFLNPKFHGEGVSPSPSISNIKYENEKQFTVIGLEVDVQVLSRMLVQETNKIIWIVGAKGIGKTTLAVDVCESRIVTRLFDVHMWVSISQEFEPRDILQILMEKIPSSYRIGKKQYSSCTTLELARELLHVFNSVRCLIVLDGLQTNEVLEALKEMKLFAVGKSRIMITTRSRTLAEPWKPNHIIHEMRTLGDQEAWELFSARVHVPKQLEKIGLELVRKCRGFPLDIVCVGEILTRRAVTKEQWLKVLNQVFKQNQESVVNDFEESVDSLPSHLKNCLSCFELFNDDFDIPIRRLIAYWVAEGHVLQEGGSKEPPEILAEKQLMDFIQKNMIQVAKWKMDGRVKTCRMNYFLRDFWLPKIKKEKWAHDKKKFSAFKLSCFHDVTLKEAAPEESSGSGMTVRLADHLNSLEISNFHIHGNQKISHSSFKKYYEGLCTLVSFDSREGPAPGEAIGSFLRRGIAAGCFTMLRVLDLEGVFRPCLPELIKRICQLRYLGLRRTYIEGLPSIIGKLLSLQTLDLKYTCIRRLPSSVWKMQQLRHIYLSESYRSRILAPPRTSSLVDLETLWGAFVDEETPIADGLDSLINLRKLSLACRLTTSQWKELADWISKLEHLESLRLRSVDEMNRPSDLYLKSLFGLNKLSSIYLLGRLENQVFVQELPASLTEITLSCSELVEDPMKKLENLPNLRILNLYASSFTGKTMVCSSQGFPLLRILNLWKLEELEEWIVEEGALAILKNLEIRSCKKFKKIPDGLKHLGACRELKLTNMPDEFNARVTANKEEDWFKIAHIPSIIIKN